MSLTALASPAPDSPEGLGLFAIQFDGRTPPAALIRFEGQSLDTPAYVLACGHCNGMPVGAFRANEAIDKPVYLHDPSGRQRAVRAHRILFGTQTGVDLLLLELTQTYREIESQFGIRARWVSPSRPAVGTPITFYNLEGVQRCQVDLQLEKIFFNDAGTDFLSDPFVYFGCVSEPGHSGSILIDESSGQIVGLNVGGSYPEEYNGKISSWASEVASLSTCLTPEKRFDLSVKGCRLRDIPTEAVRAQTPKAYATVNGCSGGLFAAPGQTEDAPALVMTNGHCVRYREILGRGQSFPEAGEVFTNLNSSEVRANTVITLQVEGRNEPVQVRQLQFATMTGTDVAVFELTETYRELRERLQIAPFLLAEKNATEGEEVRVFASYYNREQRCRVLDSITRLREGPFWTGPAIKFSNECEFYTGFSGSFTLNAANELVGLANTHYSGDNVPCSVHNPCEVEGADTTRVADPGQSYGVPLAGLAACYRRQTESFDYECYLRSLY